MSINENGSVVSESERPGGCTVVVGCQWGDEGKGKIVDVLAEDVDIVARYQGGANAGHTVHVGDEEFVLHQIPSGILHRGKRCLLGNGVVLDVTQFFEEYHGLQARGVDLEGRIGVSQRAHLLLPYHRLLDEAAEGHAVRKIGTTGRGIGPAYEFKAGRSGVRVADLANPARLRELVAAGVERAERWLEALGHEHSSELQDAVDDALSHGEALRALAADTGLEIMQALRSEKAVLLEGAQGTALDLDHGTYPFVTSSNTTAAAAATGVGVGPTAISRVIGVVKAYTTRVGNGPLPSAFDEEMDEHVRKLGGEFGATTGRPRRCGWFDAVLARYSARVNGLTGLAVTKLDVLDTLPEISIATAYRIGDDVVEEFPADTWSLGTVEPILETVPGWEASTCDARRLEDLPSAARHYLDRIQTLTGAPVDMISVGTRRSQIIRSV
ncbi:MAG: adenylosuccinate synthase [Gemmatimonadota bacterium]|nr:MAG: adenylosuccinate synthase [Gemmatimonadota bacterium]